MRKQQLMELKVGDKVISKKDNTVKTVTAINEKIELDNKAFSQSTMIRWYSLYEEDNTDTEEFDVESFNSEQQQEQDTTADTEEQEDTDTTATTVNTDTVNEVHDQHDTTTKKDVVEGNTATTNTVKTNTVQPTIQQNNLIQSLNNLVDLHGCYLEPKKEYIAVKKDDYKGTVCMIRNSRYGNGIHIDMKSKIWTALDEEYRQVVSKHHYTGIYDKTRRLQRIGYVNDLSILEVIICTALQIA